MDWNKNGPRKLDGSWAGGKGSFRRRTEDKDAYDRGYEAIFGDNKSEPKPSAAPQEALLNEWRKQLDKLQKEVEDAEEAVEEAKDRVSRFMEGKDELL